MGNSTRLAIYPVIVILTGCGPDPGVNESTRLAVLQQVNVDSSQGAETLPKLPGGTRAPLNCCLDPGGTAIVNAYLALEQAFVEGDHKAIAQKAHELGLAAKESASNDVQPTIPPKVADRLVVTSERLRQSEFAISREYFAEISALVVREVSDTRGGDVDMAAACSLPLGWSWLQTGVELRSPYGDAPDQMSWGGCDPKKSVH